MSWTRRRQPAPIEIDKEEAAFGSAPTLAARGALLREFGEAGYRERAKAWGITGADLNRLKPGTRPTIVNGNEVPATSPTPGGSNPWSEGTWDFARQLSIVKSLGLEKAGQMS